MRRWHGIVGILLSLGVLAFIVYRLDVAALGRALAGAHYLYLVPLVATAVILHVVASLQWRYVLSPVKWVRPVWLFSAQMVGALARGLVQVQVGGLVKAYVVARRERLSMSTVVATTITDHLVDGLTFLGLLGAVLGFIDLPLAAAPAQTALRTAGLTTLGLDLGLAVSLVALAVFPAWGTRTVGRVLAVLPARWTTWGTETYARFREGICFPSRWRDRIVLLGYAAGRKVIAPIEFYWLACALGLSLPWTAYPFLVVSLSFLAFLSSSLGIRGGFQAGMVLVLGFYSVPKEIAVAIALIFVGVSRGVTMGLGLLFLWVEGITKEELRSLAARWGRSAQDFPATNIRGPLHDPRPRPARRLGHACAAAGRRWILLRDGDLQRSEAAALRRHLRECARCRRISRLVDGLLTAIRNDPIPEPDDEFWNRMREQITARITAVSPPPRATSIRRMGSPHARSWNSLKRPRGIRKPKPGRVIGV